jgi:rhomboid protease GluP
MTEFDDDDFPDPEDFKEEPERPPGPLARFPAIRHAIPALILFLAFYLATSVYNRSAAGDYLWLSGDSIFKHHEYWRLLTSLCTHADLYHLFSNALIFLVFGWMLRAYFGLFVFPGVSLATGLLTNLLTIAAYDPAIKLLGASGMAYGMVALWLVFYIHHDVDHTVPMRIFRAIGFSLVMMFPTTFDPHVSYLAHAIGFGTGLVLGLILLPFVRIHEPL